MSKAKLNLPAIVVAFGRFNPPTRGHEVLFSKVIKKAEEVSGIPMVFLSSTQDRDKNPLSWTQKFNFIKQLMPKFSWIVSKEQVKDPFELISYLSESGYKEIYFVAGEDRVSAFESKLSEFAIEQCGVEHFEVVLAAKRNDKKSLSSAEGISASKLRSAAASGKFNQFALGLSNQSGNQKPQIARQMFNAVRRGLGLKPMIIEEGTTYLDIGHNTQSMMWFFNGKKLQFHKVTAREIHPDTFDDFHNYIGNDALWYGRIDPEKKMISYVHFGDFRDSMKAKSSQQSLYRVFSKKFPGYKHLEYGTYPNNVGTVLDEQTVKRIPSGSTYLSYGHPYNDATKTRQTYDIWTISYPKDSKPVIWPKEKFSGHADISDDVFDNVTFCGRIDHEQKAVTVARVAGYGDSPKLNDRKSTFILDKYVIPFFRKKYPGYDLLLNSDVTYAPGLDEQFRKAETEKQQ